MYKRQANIISLPQAIAKIFDASMGEVHTVAAIMGVLTILGIIVWDKVKPQTLRFIPGALIGILLASVGVALLGSNVNMVTLPDDLLGSMFSFPVVTYDLSLFASGGFIMTVFAIALVASAETLLCAVAVDKMHQGERTNFNKELMSQGLGNILCGICAALPMTGVIVRSSANIQAGAKTRWSAIFHGLWLFAFVTLMPSLLEMIPTCSLAALLVFIGYRLINIASFKEIRQQGNYQFPIFLVTLCSIVAFDLLTGIVIGLIVAACELLYRVTHLEMELSSDRNGEFALELSGAATFMRLPKLAEKLESLPDDAILHVYLKKLHYVDHACLELLIDWEDKHSAQGGQVFIEWDDLHKHSSTPTDTTDTTTNRRMAA